MATHRNFFAALAVVFFFLSSHAVEAASPLTLFYTNAAVKWTEALPIGNGWHRAGVIPGMSRKGNCYDNATMESSWST